MSEKSGLRAIGYTEKCGHNFPPMECPYGRCGYREAMARVAELGKENEKLHMQVARLAKSCAELSGKGLAKDARLAIRELVEAYAHCADRRDAKVAELEAAVVYWKARLEQEERLRDALKLMSTVMERK